MKTYQNSRLVTIRLLWKSVFFVLFTVICGQGFSQNGKHLKNVIVIIGDDHSTNTVGCYGNNIIRTPNIDKLASEGYRFTNAFANSPVCSASRQSLLTGKYPQASGVTLLHTSFPDSQVTIAEHLKENGFATGFVGKMHFNNNLPHGFDYRIQNPDWQNYLKTISQPPLPQNMDFRPPWKPFNDPAEIWLNADMLPAAVYDTFDVGTYYARKANEFISQNKEGNFCLWVGFHEPHSPFNFPVEFYESFNPDSVPLPLGSDEDNRWIPEVFKNLTEQQRRGIVASYYTSVEYMDKNVGLILNKIKELGIEDETLIIYLGDHGYLLNDHKRFEKHMMWEEAVRAPLIIRAGNTINSGSTIESLTEFVDLAPTIFDLCNVNQLSDLQGKSLVPVLKNDTDEVRHFIFSVFYADNKAMIRSKELKYIFTSGKNDLGMGYATGLGAPGLTHRLYDLTIDPNETTNQSSNPEYLTILMQLKDTMLQRFEETHPFAEYLPQGLSIDEKLSWFCEPPENFHVCTPTNNYPEVMALEDFDYPVDNTLLNESGGLNWKGVWKNIGNLSSNKATIVSGNLSGQNESDGGASVKIQYLNNNSQIRLLRELTYPIISNNSDYWMSFSMSTPSGDAKDNVANIMLTRTNDSGGTDQRIAFGRMYGTAKLGVVMPPENKTWLSEVPDLGTNHFLIQFSTQCSKDKDSVYVWINPEKDMKPTYTSATFKFETAVLKNGLDGVMLKCEGAGANQAPHTVFFDNIRIGKSFKSLQSDNTHVQNSSVDVEMFRVYPNPSSKQMNVKFKNNTLQNVSVKISSVSGLTTYFKDFGQLNKGIHVLDINLEDSNSRFLSPGLYLVHLKLGVNEYFRKVLYS